MVELYSLIKNLHADELTVIKSSFRKSSNDADGHNLLEKLFSLILSQKNGIQSDKQLSIAIYQDEKSTAWSKLKSRLFYYILDQIISDTLLLKDNQFDPSDRQQIKIRKKMLQFRAVYRKKNKVDYTVQIHLLNEIIKEAKEYELYDLLVEALYHKKYMVMLRKGFDEIREIEKQILHYEYAQKALFKTHDHYFDLITNQDIIQKKKPVEVQKLFRGAISEINEFIKVTDSSIMKYICKFLQLDELIREGKHEFTIDICLDIISLLKKYKLIYRKERMGFIYDNISLCQIHNNDFDNAILSVREAQNHYSKSSISFLFSKQQEFYATFYAGKYRSAHSIIEDLLSLPLMNTGEYRYDKFLFLKACTLFKLDDYRNALTICNQVIEITKDKGRWDMGIRYLRFMCMVELMAHDNAYHLLDALRKTLSRKNNKQLILTRDELIYRAFNEFAYTGFDKVPTSKLQDVLKKLAEKNGPHSWNYYSHELIPIHLWIESKIKASALTVKVPVKR